MVVAQDEQKHKVIAAALTTVIAGLVFLLLLIEIGWSSAGASGSDFGVEVNLGNSSVGYGDVQPTEPVGNDMPQTQEEQAQTPPPSPASAPAVQEEAARPAEAEPVDPEPVTASDEESPVEINEKKKKEVKQPVEKTVEKPKEKPAPVQPKEEKKQPVKEVKEVKKEPVPDNNAEYKPGKSTGKTSGDASGKEGKPGNHGDDPGTVGDKGNPDGGVDANALYGKQGGGQGGTGGTGTTGASLDLNGWQWDDKPRPNIVNKNETGRLELEIEVDEDGELTGYKKISGGLSAANERACIDALLKSSFSKSAGAKVPKFTKGRVVFTVRSE